MKTKIILITLCLMVGSLASFSKPNKVESFSDIISKSPLYNSSTISVSIKNAKSGHTVFEADEKKLLHPASTLKLFTTMAALDTLGQDYKFVTSLYKDSANNLYIKLGADPTLTSLDLKGLIRSLSSKQYNAVYIDDSVIDDMNWGESWMSDDTTNPLFPKFSPYNLDRNLLKVKIVPNVERKTISLDYGSTITTSIINNIKFGNIDSVTTVRRDWKSPDMVYLEGSVSKPTTIFIPVNNPARYFNWRFKDLLSSSRIKYVGEISTRQVPKNATLLTSKEAGIDGIITNILQNSDNLSAETVFKVAGGKFANAKGNAIYSQAMFLDYYDKLKLSASGLNIADASGISRNDLVSTTWMTDALVNFYDTDGRFEYLKNHLANPIKGTFSNRLIPLLGNVWVKTGTLSNISAVTGYVQSKNKDVYAFTILIQNFTQDQSVAKKLEDDIITNMSELN